MLMIMLLAVGAPQNAPLTLALQSLTQAPGNLPGLVQNCVDRLMPIRALLLMSRPLLSSYRFCGAFSPRAMLS